MRAAPLASWALPALAAVAVLVLGVPMVRLAASHPDTAPGGGAPWQIALQAAAAASAVIAGAALAARRATVLCGTLLALAGPAAVPWQLVGGVRGRWLAVLLCCTALGPPPGRSVTPERSGIGSACWKATVYRFVTTEAGVEHTFAAGQSGELLLKAANLC